MSKSFIILFLSFVTIVCCYGQDYEKIVSESWKKSIVLDSLEEVEWKPLLEDDIAFQKEAWRVIKHSDTLNKPLNAIIKNTTTKSLIDLMILFANEGKIKLYVDIKDTVKLPIGVANDYVVSISDKIDSYLLREWLAFDDRYGRTVVKITGIAPSIEISKGEYKPLFWVKYPELREVVDNYYVKMPDGGTELLRKYFDERHFRSTIINTTKWEKTGN